MSSLAVDDAAPLFVVVNAGSGNHGPKPVSEVIGGILSEAGRAHDICVVDDPARLAHAAGRAVENARSRGGIVVAAGGDGTVNAVVQALLGSGCPFGVVPQGTFNYFGRTHGLPADPEEATRLLLTARAHPVQVGLVNERVFLVNASLGLYPQILQDREAHEKQFGRTRMVAFMSGLVTLLREHRQLRLRIEGSATMRQMRTPTLVACNNRLQLEDLGIAEAELLEHGQLAAVALRPVGTVTMLWLLLRGLMGKLGEADDIVSFGFERITVTPAMPYGTRRVKVATDGEVGWLRAPLEFRVARDPLYLLKPDPAGVAVTSP